MEGEEEIQEEPNDTLVVSFEVIKEEPKEEPQEEIKEEPNDTTSVSFEEIKEEPKPKPKPKRASRAKVKIIKEEVAPIIKEEVANDQPTSSDVGLSVSFETVVKEEPKPKPKRPSRVPKPKPKPEPVEQVVQPQVQQPREITREDVNNFLRNERIEKARHNQQKFSKLFSAAV